MNVSTRDRGVYLFGAFRLDPIRRTLLRDGAPVTLAPRLFDTLHHLVANHERLVEKSELIAAVWGRRTVEEANLSQAIFALRKALQTDATDDKIVVTAPGRGYRCGVPVVFEAEPGNGFGAAAAESHGAIAGTPVPKAGPWWRSPAALAAEVVAVTLFCAVLWQSHLRTTKPQPQPVAAAPFEPPPHSVAVLPFTNLSGDPAQEYFSDGLSEELIDALGRVRSLRVPARVSSFSFKGRQVAIGDIARQLNVGAVLEGSVRRTRDTLRISARLIDSTTGYQIWANEYDRAPGDAMLIQGEIATSLINALKATLLNDDGLRLTLGGTTNANAQDAYLRGLKLDYETSNDADQEAFKNFSLAVSLDPKFALAHVQRAFSLSNLVEFGSSPNVAIARGMLDAALADANSAILLAPNLGRAHEARANVLLDRDLDFATAGIEYAQARDLEGGNPWIQMKYGLYQIYLGRTAQGIAAAEAGVNLDPVNGPLYLNLAEVLFFSRRYSDTMLALQHARQFGGSGMVRALGLAGLTDILTGDAGAAVKACAAARDIIETECLILSYQALGRQKEATALLGKLQAAAGDEGAFNYAEVYAKWGDVANAVQWLRTAYKLHDPGLIFLKVDPFLDAIRNTPQFNDIEMRMNFPE